MIFSILKRFSNFRPFTLLWAGLVCLLVVGSAAGIIANMTPAPSQGKTTKPSSPAIITTNKATSKSNPSANPAKTNSPPSATSSPAKDLKQGPVAIPDTSTALAVSNNQNTHQTTPNLPLPIHINAPAYPNVATTGVPQNASIAVSNYYFLGEGITDGRPIEPLTPATPGNTGMSAPDNTGLVYLPNAAVDLLFDHIDFTNLKLVVPAAVKSVTFTKCLFQTTDPGLSLNRAQGAWLVQVLGAATKITITDNTLKGATPDPNYAVQLFLSTPSGNNSVGGVTFIRNNLSGFSTALSLGAFDSFLFDSNYVHDLVIDKHADVAPYTNSAVWTHIDGFQIGYTNYVGTGRVTNNNLNGFSATNQIATGPLQVGQMAGPGTATITSFVFDGNYLDGGSYMVGANLNTPIMVAQKFEFTNNKFGLNYAYGVDGANSIHSLATLWSGNTFYKTGTAQTNRPIQVTAGQAIP